MYVFINLFSYSLKYMCNISYRCIFMGCHFFIYIFDNFLPNSYAIFHTIIHSFVWNCIFLKVHQTYRNCLLSILFFIFKIFYAKKELSKFYMIFSHTHHLHQLDLKTILFAFIKKNTVTHLKCKKITCTEKLLSLKIQATRIKFRICKFEIKNFLWVIFIFFFYK